jgi:hypothetical protein
MSQGPLPINTKILGGPSHFGWNTKGIIWRDGPDGERYYSDDEDRAPAPTPSASGPSWNDDAMLLRAKAAGRRALQAGYGGVLPNGLAPCGTCPSCVYGHPEGCRRPKQKAIAQLEAAQAQARRIDRAERWAVELQGVVWREENRRQLAF